MALISLMAMSVAVPVPSAGAPDVPGGPAGREDMVPVKGGCFKMGDPTGKGDRYERPVHEVCVDDFFMDITEVTQAAYRERTGESPSRFGGCDRCPVEMVSWVEADAYCRGLGKRLPTEAEWEYAAKSGGRDQMYSGTSESPEQFAWFSANAGMKTHPVATKKPNGLGLYDMSGNVWEWVSDWYVRDYYRDSPRNNPKGGPKGMSRIMRGGSWFEYKNYARTSARFRYYPEFRGHSFGFRCAAGP